MASLKARLLKASARLLGTAARDVPVAYELPCECGHRVTGIRRATGTQMVCSACQTTIYVLPVNVYPSTRRVRSEVIDGSLAKRVGVLMKDLVVGDSPPEDKTPVTVNRPPDRANEQVPDVEDPAEHGRRTATGNRRGSAADRAASKSERQEHRAVAGSAPPEIEVTVRVPRVRLGTRLRRLFSPVRLLAVAGIMVLCGTGWWMIHQRRFEEARRVWRQEIDVADAAIRDEDLMALRTALTKAVSAAAILGRSDAETRRAQSLLEQTEAVEGLSSLDLIELLTGATAADGRVIPSKAKEASAALSGQRFVFDCPLSSTSTSKSLLVAELPLFAGSIPVRIQVDSSRLQRLALTIPNESVLFSAQVERIEPPHESPGEWRITLNGHSCALLTTALHVSRMGYDPDTTQAMIPLLQRQAEFIESDRIDESPEQPHDESTTESGA